MDYEGLRTALRRHKARKDAEFDIPEIAALLADRDRLAGDAARYNALFECGLPFTFLGVDYFDKATLDAAIDTRGGSSTGTREK